ncbi:hypothetical protein K474DRAFT_1714389 [Panus rudis PR-1116 ss-1]|nr:hypothetical protein K474DRAFT_1714389 [Panus rudis PR-1116 ss-1]
MSPKVIIRLYGPWGQRKPRFSGSTLALTTALRIQSACFHAERLADSVVCDSSTPTMTEIIVNEPPRVSRTHKHLEDRDGRPIRHVIRGAWKAVAST